MNEMQAKDEIRLIQEMIEKTRRITAGSWMFFLVWGIVATLGVAGMYVLVLIEQYSWIWLNWVVFMGIGVVFSIVYGKKHEKQQGVRTYPYIATFHACFACGMAFILVGFIFPLLKLYSWGLIAVLISLIAGVLAFTLGGIYDWNLLKWCGVLWWLGAIGMVFIHENYRALLFLPLLLIGYIMPALVLRSMYYKQSD
ncbi:MAG: hypothetical protein JSV46_00025 [Candidatus Aminicenantes bacterium]|nr:MAG: hypothetical protein JSV46_00025 [Candidatus Aminicenantes bacterium]